MDYVYHMVPKDMKGEVLISLNEIKSNYPELYKIYSKKYLNHPERESLLLRSIPKLNCLWNDVIFLLPLHPYYVYEALQSLGVSIKKDLMFYEIPTERLIGNKNAVYFYNKENYKGQINEFVKTDMEKRNGTEEMFFMDEFNGIKDEPNFYIDDEGYVIIVFDKYEIAPRLYGLP